MAVPYGRAYSRQDIRALLETDKRRKKKILLVFIPALLVVVGAIAALLVVFVFGGGLSPEEYKEEIADDHHQVVVAMEAMDRVWTTADTDADITYSEGYSDLNTESETTLSDLRLAQEQLNQIKPPSELEELHNELSALYTDTENYLLRADAVFVFVEGWASTMEEWGEKPWAMERAAEGMTPAELIALIDEDIASSDEFIARIKALDTPPECESMRDSTMDYWEEGKSLLERLKRGLINHDVVALEAAEKDAIAFNNNYDAWFMQAWDGINSFQDEFWDLLDKAEELEEELGGKAPQGDEDELVGVGVRSPIRFCGVSAPPHFHVEA